PTRERPRTTDTASGPAPRGTDACHVLLVDDNPVSRAALHTALTAERAAGLHAPGAPGVPGTLRVLEAADTRHAHETALHRRPDVALLDTHTAATGSDQDLTDLLHLVPTLLLTRREDNEVLQRALRLGALGYLVHGDFTGED
ncbi:response regulator transcription factor, partial [Streptomyces durbertensis]|nr:response regulator transcription factor [Streptomyces durbertensis]